MNKAYSRINFQNAPSTATPLNATNLNKMDKAINDLDDRIIELSGYQEEAEESAEMASASASAAAKAAETATADAEARVNAIIEGLEVYTKEESDKKFAPVIKQVATGSPILIKDGTDAGTLDFKGKGRSTQKQYSGKNLLENTATTTSLNGGTFTVNEDGSVNAKGTFTDTTEFSIGIYNATENSILSGCPSGGSENTYQLRSSGIGADYGGGLRITAGSNTSIYIRVMSGQTIDITFKPMVRLASITDATYEPYVGGTASPNPNYPQPINSVADGGSLEIKSIGKNLLKNTATTQSINGVTFAVNEDKSVTVNGTSNAWVNILIGSIKMTSNLTLSSETVGTSNGNAKIQFYNATKSLHITELSNGSYEYDNSNGDIIEVWTGIAPSTTVNDLTFYPMIRKAEVTDDTYEPYKETVTYIPLNEPLRSSLDGSVTDVASLNEINRKFAEDIFDGSESWVLFSTNTFAISVVSAKGNGNAVCSHYKYSTDGANNTFYIRPSGTITFVDTTCATLAEWKAKLQANPITVIYELAEPITETIEPVDIVTYDNVTYISNADNAEMEVTYATDTKSYIDSKFAELHAALVNML